MGCVAYFLEEEYSDWGGFGEGNMSKQSFDREYTGAGPWASSYRILGPEEGIQEESDNCQPRSGDDRVLSFSNASTPPRKRTNEIEEDPIPVLVQKVCTPYGVIVYNIANRLPWHCAM